MVTLRDLQYLVSLEKYRHFGKAAQACFVSQPTLSGQFKKLEDYLGVTLVERNRHQVVMTAAGTILAARARALITDAIEFEKHAKALIDPYSGELHLGLVPTIAPYLLSRVMSPLSNELPNVSIYLHEEQTNRLISKLDQGELDLLVAPKTEEMDIFEQIDLFFEPLYLALPIGHPLASKKNPTLKDLDGHEVLTLEDGHCLRQDAMRYCFAAGAKENQQFRATSLETLRYMVANGNGITLIPELAIPESPTENIIYRNFSKPIPGRSICAVYRKGYAKEELVEQIAKIVIRIIKG